MTNQGKGKYLREPIRTQNLKTAISAGEKQVTESRLVSALHLID